ncbi:hypothetical protein BHM03_00015733 [Ensete ventricosum]|nr:hypothetical protein BHM03_00015733 [Ensete ventricosum]
MAVYRTSASPSPSRFLLRQLFEKESSTYTYLLADLAHPDKPAVVRATPGHTQGCVTYVTGNGPDQPYPRMAFTDLKLDYPKMMDVAVPANMDPVLCLHLRISSIVVGDGGEVDVVILLVMEGGVDANDGGRYQGERG